jgi:ferritin-like metal-binding protein YciE
MITLEEYRIAQQARYAKEHEADMVKYPWIRESINAYKNATPEQLAQVEAIVSKRGGF